MTKATMHKDILSGWAAAAAASKYADPEPKRRRRKAARLPFEPTDEQRALVMRLKLAGISHKLIADTIGVSVTSLVRHFEHELSGAMAELNGNIAATIYQRAVSGDTACLIFWCKARMGWREKRSMELTGGEGAPLLLPSIGLEVVDGDFARALPCTQLLEYP